MELFSFIATLLLIFVVYKVLDYLLRLPTVGQYSERYILVTGCGSGFGRAFVHRLDELGCHVFAGCSTETGRLELNDTCSERIQTLVLEASKHDSVLRAFDFVRSRLPPGKGLWAVVNNAGIVGAAGREEWLTIDDYKQTLDANLFGTIDVTMTFLPLIKKSCGRVVNMSSVAGRLALPFATPYSISKHGVEAFSDNLRRSLRPYTCKAIVIEPGSYRSKFSSRENLIANITRTWNCTATETKHEFGEQYFRGCLKFIEMSHCSNDITPVVDAYQHAVLGRFPRARYVVGLGARLMCTTVCYLPECLSDAMWKVVTYIVPLPAALTKKKME